MATLYKLTTQDGFTQKGKPGETFWEVGLTVKASGKRGQGLCSDEFLHAYENPFMAVIMNPNHAAIQNPRMFEVEGEVEIKEGQLKCGGREFKVLREISLPKISTNQKIYFAILCGKAVYTNVEWNLWADNWLSGKDRSKEANAAYAAATANAIYSAYAAATANAIYSAYAASAATAAAASAAAASAAYAASAATAAYAASAAYAITSIDLFKLIQEAVEKEKGD